MLRPYDVALLSRAREGFDKLIVGLASDPAIRENHSLPEIDERGRALILASMASVDLVVMFDESRLETLLRSLAPNVVTEPVELHAR